MSEEGDDFWFIFKMWQILIEGEIEGVGGKKIYACTYAMYTFPFTYTWANVNIFWVCIR